MEKEKADNKSVWELVDDLLKETAADICNHFCKYSETSDENCGCDWINQGNPCPLDRIY